MTDYIKLLEDKKEEFEQYQDEICKQKLIEVFKDWADNFPDETLSVIHGMGTYSFDTTLVLFTGIEALTCSTRTYNLYWDDKYEELFRPIREYIELWESVSVGPPPCPCDMKYCGKTKVLTVDGVAL